MSESTPLSISAEQSIRDAMDSPKGRDKAPSLSAENSPTDESSFLCLTFTDSAEARKAAALIRGLPVTQISIMYGPHMPTLPERTLRVCFKNTSTYNLENLETALSQRNIGLKKVESFYPYVD